MTKDNASEKRGWAELNSCAKEYQELIHDMVEGTKKEIMQIMITAIQNKDLETIRRLAYGTVIFPNRQSILGALNYLIKI